jgi:hypothetical protein
VTVNVPVLELVLVTVAEFNTVCAFAIEPVITMLLVPLPDTVADPEAVAATVAFVAETRTMTELQPMPDGSAMV